jgi:long-chain acyl-CoA synthetase
LIHPTPLEAFLHWEKATPDNLFLRQPLNDVWSNYTYRQAGEQIRKIASALSKKLPLNSKIAILSKNCAEWIMADLAIMMADHISVPIYPTLSAESIKPLLEHSETKLIMVGKVDFFENQRSAIPETMPVISFDSYGRKEGLLWSEIIRDEKILQSFRIPLAEDLATIMYSSGTTGTPKGVMLTHGAFALVGEQVARYLSITSPERFFSYLPLSHIAERALMEMVVLSSGSVISFTQSLDKFPEDLRQERPTIFGGVPRIYSKFQEGILKKIPQKKLNTLLAIPIVRGILKRAIQKKLGLAESRIIVSGAAPTPVTLLEWFKKLGIEIREIYGMTENTAYSHANYGKIKIGTVGQPWPGVECKTNQDGEILLRHGALMKGYFKDEITTASVFTDEGFLKTGDKGEIDSEGFLTITGRVKDQFKTDKAKFIAPAQIELKLLSNTDIEQVCVVGMGLPQPIGLVILSSVGKEKQKEAIIASLLSTFEEVNKTLESYEMLEKIIIMKEGWSVENGLLTPSLKLKRTELEKKYLGRYLQWYEHPETIVWDD